MFSNNSLQNKMKEWSQRGYETPEIASRYIEYRPRPPPELVDIVVDYLKEKVII